MKVVVLKDKEFSNYDPNAELLKMVGALISDCEKDCAGVNAERGINEVDGLDEACGVGVATSGFGVFNVGGGGWRSTPG